MPSQLLHVPPDCFSCHDNASRRYSFFYLLSTCVGASGMSHVWSPTFRSTLAMMWKQWFSIPLLLVSNASRVGRLSFSNAYIIGLTNSSCNDQSFLLILILIGKSSITCLWSFWLVGIANNGENATHQVLVSTCRNYTCWLFNPYRNLSMASYTLVSSPTVAIVVCTSSAAKEGKKEGLLIIPLLFPNPSCHRLN
jgi:hypothetical protein